MDDLARLAELIKRRNALEVEITAIIQRPASIGHLGEYIAGKIFHITLVPSAAEKAVDGIFSDGPLAGRSVNIKWYAKREGLLDITPATLPDFYLVLAGEKSAAMSSRGLPRAWRIESVYLFKAPALLTQLQARGIHIGIATSVVEQQWRDSELYPEPNNQQLVLTETQHQLLKLFS